MKPAYYGCLLEDGQVDRVVSARVQASGDPSFHAWGLRCLSESIPVHGGDVGRSSAWERCLGRQAPVRTTSS